jgi:hypothetical protein
MRHQHTPGHTNFFARPCNRTFASLGKLDFHNKRFHVPQEEAPHTCTKCGNKYKNEACFLKHLKKHDDNRFLQALEGLAALAVSPERPAAPAPEEPAAAQPSTAVASLTEVAAPPTPAQPAHTAAALSHTVLTPGSVPADGNGAPNPMSTSYHHPGSAFRPYRQ